MAYVAFGWLQMTSNDLSAQSAGGVEYSDCISDDE